MNEAGLFEYRERVQKLRREDLHELSAEALELVLLDKLVEVNAQQLHGDAQVAAEVEVLRHLEGMMLLLLVLKEPSVL